MPSLYKGLPQQYVADLLAGRILFRNLVYFKKLEKDVRADLHEGVHIDAPDHPVRLETLDMRVVMEDQLAFHSGLKHPELVYCFCTSTAPLGKFGDACVEIGDPAAFELRLNRALARRNLVSKLERPYVRSGAVRYFRPNAAAPDGVDIKDPTHLPFLKRVDFEDEREFRFVFARRRGYQLLERIVTPGFDARDDISGKPEDSVVIEIGPITDIARQIR